MRWLSLYFVGLLMCLATANAFAGSKYIVTYTSKDDFEIVKSAVLDAVTSKGLVINTTSHLGEMLERTGKDLGKTKQIFLQAESYEFCSATVSRLTMEVDPHNIVLCPYIIAVYVLPNEPKKTYISFRKPEPVGSPASKKAVLEIEKLLRSIIEDAIK